MSEVVWVVSFLEFLGVLMPNITGVFGKELHGYDVSLYKNTSSDETIVVSAFPLCGSNFKYKIQN